MPKEENTILVEPVAGSVGLLFRVESWTNPSQPYHVDLSYYHGNGLCICPDFCCRREPNVKKELADAAKENREPVLFTKSTTCRHIRAAHHYWFRHALKAVVEAHGQQRKNHDE